MIKVQGGAQNYGWGRKGSASWVSQFISNVSEELPYAEYWLGTHPSLPSTVNGRLLSSVTGDLPYLFKILSISKPLSIQLHPNKAQAIRLHELSPVLYPDSNYKPEMCIARDRMKLFIGFKPLQEISEVINSTPELDYLKNYPNLASKLSRLYENEAETRELVSKYCERVGLGLYWDINQQFPNDPGVFFSMFMNYVELSEGESIIIHAGIPHCYIEGECIEAMACSDNVVRAGLTPKAKDINTLLEVFHI
jgi:mannose-6-phosphate isomerase